MKPLILIIALVVLAGCGSETSTLNYSLSTETVGGHVYIVGHNGATGIIHAEHCQCKGGGK